MDTQECILKGCDQTAIPPAFWRDETVDFITGKSGKYKGGLGFCQAHDEEMTNLFRHRRQVSKLHNSRPDLSIVYFIRTARPESCAGLIKIGTTEKLALRHHALGGELLLTEPGGRAHEGRMHARFWHLWMTGEWHRPGSDLLAYIESRRAA